MEKKPSEAEINILESNLIDNIKIPQQRTKSMDSLLKSRLSAFIREKTFDKTNRKQSLLFSNMLGVPDNKLTQSRKSIADLKISMQLDHKTRKRLTLNNTVLKESELVEIDLRNIEPEYVVKRKRIIDFKNKFDKEVGKLKEKAKIQEGTGLNSYIRHVKLNPVFNKKGIFKPLQKPKKSVSPIFTKGKDVESVLFFDEIPSLNKTNKNTLSNKIGDLKNDNYEDTHLLLSRHSTANIPILSQKITELQKPFTSKRDIEQKFDESLTVLKPKSKTIEELNKLYSKKNLLESKDVLTDKNIELKKVEGLDLQKNEEKIEKNSLLDEKEDYFENDEDKKEKSDDFFDFKKESNPSEIEDLKASGKIAVDFPVDSLDEFKINFDVHNLPQLPKEKIDPNRFFTILETDEEYYTNVSDLNKFKTQTTNLFKNEMDRIDESNEIDSQIDNSLIKNENTINDAKIDDGFSKKDTQDFNYIDLEKSEISGNEYFDLNKVQDDDMQINSDTILKNKKNNEINFIKDFDPDRDGQKINSEIIKKNNFNPKKSLEIKEDNINTSDIKQRTSNLILSRNSFLKNKEVELELSFEKEDDENIEDNIRTSDINKRTSNLKLSLVKNNEVEMELSFEKEDENTEFQKNPNKVQNIFNSNVRQSDDNIVFQDKLIDQNVKEISENKQKENIYGNLERISETDENNETTSGARDEESNTDVTFESKVQNKFTKTEDVHFSFNNKLINKKDNISEKNYQNKIENKIDNKLENEPEIESNGNIEKKNTDKESDNKIENKIDKVIEDKIEYKINTGSDDKVQGFVQGEPILGGELNKKKGHNENDNKKNSQILEINIIPPQDNKLDLLKENLVFGLEEKMNNQKEMDLSENFDKELQSSQVNLNKNSEILRIKENSSLKNNDGQFIKINLIENSEKKNDLDDNKKLKNELPIDNEIKTKNDFYEIDKKQNDENVEEEINKKLIQIKSLPKNIEFYSTKRFLLIKNQNNKINNTKLSLPRIIVNFSKKPENKINLSSKRIILNSSNDNIQSNIIKHSSKIIAKISLKQNDSMNFINNSSKKVLINFSKKRNLSSLSRLSSKKLIMKYSKRSETNYLKETKIENDFSKKKINILKIKLKPLLMRRSTNDEFLIKKLSQKNDFRKKKPKLKVQLKEPENFSFYSKKIRLNNSEKVLKIDEKKNLNINLNQKKKNKKNLTNNKFKMIKENQNDLEDSNNREENQHEDDSIPKTRTRGQVVKKNNPSENKKNDSAFEIKINKIESSLENPLNDSFSDSHDDERKKNRKGVTFLDTKKNESSEEDIKESGFGRSNLESELNSEDEENDEQENDSNYSNYHFLRKVTRYKKDKENEEEFVEKDELLSGISQMQIPLTKMKYKDIKKEFRENKELKRLFFTSFSCCFIFFLSSFLWIVLFNDLSNQNMEVSNLIMSTPTLEEYHDVYTDFYAKFNENQTKTKLTQEILEQRNRDDYSNFKKSISDFINFQNDINTKMLNIKAFLVSIQFDLGTKRRILEEEEDDEEEDINSEEKNMINYRKKLIYSNIQNLDIIKKKIDLMGRNLRFSQKRNIQIDKVYTKLLTNIRDLYLNTFKLIDCYGTFYKMTNRMWITIENIFHYYQNEADKITKEVEKKHFVGITSKADNLLLPEMTFLTGAAINKVPTLNIQTETLSNLICSIKAEVDPKDLTMLNNYYDLFLIKNLDLDHIAEIKSKIDFKIGVFRKKSIFYQIIDLPPGSNNLQLFGVVKNGDVAFKQIEIECLKFENYKKFTEFEEDI